jgi:HK97 family phage portal protein
MKIFGFEISRPGGERRSLENPAVSLDDPAWLGSLGIGGDYMSSAPAVVTPANALGVSAVYACVFLIAKTYAWLPCHLVQKQGKRTRLATEHPLFNVMNQRPNSYQTPYIYRLSSCAQALLWGGGFSEIQRDVRTGRPLGLYPIAATDVTVKLDRGIKSYRVRGAVLDDQDVFHLQAPGFDGVSGLSPIRQHRMTIGMALEALSYGEQFYRNGTKLAGALEHPGKVSADAASRLRASFSETYAGKANAGKVAILEEGMKFNPFTMPMEDAQYIETRKFGVSDIARIYGVPPHKVGDLDKATFSNIEHQGIEFVNDCMMPWLVQSEQEADLKLLTEEERAAGYTFKHNVKALLRGDMKAQAEYLKIGREGGWYSVDDVRAKLDEDPIPAPGGDEYIRPSNFVPLGTPASTMPAPAAQDPAADPAATDPADPADPAASEG